MAKIVPDVIVIYDDLTSHAQTYREVALLSGVSPGRDSYPGDMFYTDSSLLERAGRLSSGAHLTSIPLVNVPSGDITAYLPTNIMSITDGQWILDMDTFRKGLRPALSVGLSVTRVGSAGSNRRQKALSSQALKLLADYRQAEEFSHFGSELALESKKALETGKNVLDLLTQAPGETYSSVAQQLMLDIVLNQADGELIDMQVLKREAPRSAGLIKKEEDFETVRDQLKAACLIEIKGKPNPAAQEAK